MQLILASASPRRKALLSLFGIPFTVRAADIDETMDPGKPPFDEVARVSRSKALAVRREEGDIVIAADTIVVCQGKVLGKPHSEAAFPSPQRQGDSEIRPKRRAHGQGRLLRHPGRRGAVLRKAGGRLL